MELTADKAILTRINSWITKPRPPNRGTGLELRGTFLQFLGGSHGLHHPDRVFISEASTDRGAAGPLQVKGGRRNFNGISMYGKQTSIKADHQEKGCFLEL